MHKMKRGDLHLKDYKWSAKSAGDNPDYRHGLDRRQLNRLEGDEVLHFINNTIESVYSRLVKKSDEDVVTFGKYIEYLIRHAVPKEIRDSKDIFDWIVKYDMTKRWISD